MLSPGYDIDNTLENLNITNIKAYNLNDFRSIYYNFVLFEIGSCYVAQTDPELIM